MLSPRIDLQTLLDKAEYEAQAKYLKERFPEMSDDTIDQLIYIALMDADFIEPVGTLKIRIKDARAMATKIMKEDQPGPETVREVPADIDFDEQTLPSVTLPWKEEDKD